MIMGDIYEGNQINDKKERIGKMIDNNGDIYEGKLTNNLKEGNGKMICMNNDI